jgi:hypothetical protein
LHPGFEPQNDVIGSQCQRHPFGMSSIGMKPHQGAAKKGLRLKGGKKWFQLEPISNMS